MLATVSSHAPSGFDGELVSVEVDIRRGLPGVDLVGLPDNAVRESRERVRVAIRNSAFEFPVGPHPRQPRARGHPQGGRLLRPADRAGHPRRLGAGRPVPAGRIMVRRRADPLGRGAAGARRAVRRRRGPRRGHRTTYMVPAENVDEARALEAGRDPRHRLARRGGRAVLADRGGRRSAVRSPDGAGAAAGSAAARGRRFPRRPRGHPGSPGAEARARDRGRGAAPSPAVRPSGQREDHGGPAPARAAARPRRGRRRSR